MDTLTSIKAFHQVVQTGSFTKAADKMDMSIAMTSKHITNLENRLGTKLLHHNSRSVHLTAIGGEYYAQSLYALEVLDSAKQSAQGATSNAKGVLKITMPLWFANAKVAGWLTEFQMQYPEVILDLSLSNDMVDLVAGGYDLALRLSNQPKPSLITRPLTKVEFYAVASPDYLQKYGVPKSPDELSTHQTVTPSYVKMDSFDIVHKSTGEKHTIQPVSHIYSNDTLMSAELIKSGAGLGYMPSWVIEDELCTKKLVRLFSDYQMLSVGLYAAYVDRAFLSAKVRAFIDFWVDKCSDCDV